MSSYRCTICKKQVVLDAGTRELYPFCSARCRWVDLGLWLREAYSIDRDLTPEDAGAEPPSSQGSGGQRER